jgi:hypothetical protein
MERLLKLSMLVTGILFAAQVVVMTGGHLITNHDPFAPYVSIMPGQSIDNLKGFSCALQVEMNSGVEFGFRGCIITPTESPFSRISANESDLIITRIDFTIIPYRFSLGDAVLCWGNPAI